MGRQGKWIAVVVLLGLLALSGCAAGPGSRWAGSGAPAAGFFPGLWHGAILLVSLVVSFFTKDVRIYELHNTGVAYEIGFVLGVLIVYGSGLRVTAKRKRCFRVKDDDLGKRIDREIRRRIGKILDEDQDWKEIGQKLEKKVKEKLRRWLDEEEGR